MTFLKGWKTHIANVLMSILPIMTLTEFQAILPVEWMPYYALGMVLANMALREITRTPARGKA